MEGRRWCPDLNKKTSACGAAVLALKGELGSKRMPGRGVQNLAPTKTEGLWDHVEGTWP